MAIPIPDDVRELLQAPNYVHLSTLRADGSPHNWVVRAGLEDDRILALPVRLGRTSVPAARLGTPGAKDGAVSAPALKPGT
jgi:Pyridoxamine 5'-phosphate oxidase